MLLLSLLVCQLAGAAPADDTATQLPRKASSNSLITCVEHARLSAAEQDPADNAVCTQSEHRALVAELMVTLQSTRTHLSEDDDQSAADPWANFDELIATVEQHITPQPVDEKGLAQLAAEVVVALPEPEATSMEKLRLWLKEVLADSEWWEQLNNWLEEFAPSASLHPGFFWTVAVAFILGTVGFVLYEFWRAGVFRSGRKPQVTVTSVAPVGMTPARARGIRELSGISQARALFRAALDELRAAGALPASNSYTNRNLALLLNTAEQPSELATDVAEQFQSLQRYTDLALYANHPPAGERWDALVDYWVDGEKIS